MSDNQFGAALRVWRRNSRDHRYGGQLSQNRLADLLSEEVGLVYSRAAVSDWERGKGHIHKDARPVLVGLIKVLHEAGGLATREEAEAWLASGNYRGLDTREAASIDPAWIAPPTESDAASPFLPPLMPQHPIVGRDESLGRLKEWLFDGRSLALSSINGLPGMGKTALALLAAHDIEVRERFPDGVLWVGLGLNPDIFGLLGRWATAVGIPEDELAKLGAQRLRVDAIHQTIRDRQMLIVIDDVWDADHALPFKLGGAQSAHILTSRQPRIAAAFAGPHAMTVRELSKEQGLALLRWLAPRVVERHEADARRLVEQSGGLPLALVLIGNELRLSAYSGSERRLRAVLEGLQTADRRMRLEQPGSPIESELHPSLEPGAAISLQAIIQATDDRLPKEARDALRALALFPSKPNSFSETAALAVTGATVETLDTLVDHGLLETAERDRYALHQSIYDYAHVLPGERSAAAGRFIAYVQAFVEQNRDDRAALEQELDNITTALQLAEASGNQETLWTLLEALLPFFDDRGYYDVALRMLQRIDERSTTVNPAIKHHLGRLEIVLEHVDTAQVHLEAGLGAARAAGDNAMAGRILNSLSQIASQQRRFGEAAAYLAEAAEAAEAQGDWFEVARALGNSGRVASLGDDFVTAESYYQRALAVAREHEFESLVSGILNLMGVAAVDLGRPDEALERYREGLDVSRNYRLDGRTSTLLANIGELLNDLGRHEEAIAYLDEGITLARRLDDVAQVGHMMMDMGVALAGLAQYDKAVGHFTEAFSIAAELGNQWQKAYVAARWGNVAVDAGDFDSARSLLSIASKLAPNIHSSAQVEGLSRFGLARLAMKEGDVVEANKQSAAALSILETSDHALTADVRMWRDEKGLSDT